MPSDSSVPSRYVGLDVHRHYLVGVAVNRQGAQVLGPVRVEWPDLERWVQQHLTQQDAVVFEMTANGLKLHDDLLPHVQSVTVVHPPHLALITHTQVKTDQKAALAQAASPAPALLDRGRAHLLHPAHRVRAGGRLSFGVLEPPAVRRAVYRQDQLIAYSTRVEPR